MGVLGTVALVTGLTCAVAAACSAEVAPTGEHAGAVPKVSLPDPHSSRQSGNGSIPTRRRTSCWC